MNQNQQNPKPKKPKPKRDNPSQVNPERPKPSTKKATSPKTNKPEPVEPVLESLEVIEVDLPQPPSQPIPKIQSQMIPFLPKPKFDIKTILILIMAVVILAMSLFNGCNGTKEPGKTIKIAGKSYEIIKHEIDTVFTEHPKTVTKAGKDIYHDTTIYVEIPQAIDTSAILKDYYAKKVKKDSLELPDSLGYVKVTDTIFKNDILARKWEAVVRKMTITDRMIVKEPNKNQLYIGMTAGFDRVKLINYVGPTMILKTKKDRLYSAGFGYSHDGRVSVQGGVYWKIKLKK